MIRKALRIECQNGAHPLPYLELQIEPGEVTVVANSNKGEENIFLKFDEHEFIELCKEYICIVDEYKKRYE